MRVPESMESLTPQGVAANRTPFLGVFGRLVAAVRREVEKQQALRQLAAMDDRMLADIGVSRGSIPYCVTSFGSD